MFEDEQSTSGRSGIWGINPYGPTIKQTPVITTAIQSAMQTAQGVNSLYAQRYANQLANAKAQLAQGTLGSSIDAANTRNQADIQNYPLQQMFKTQQDEQTVKEIMARTGLSYAQAQQAMAAAGTESAKTGLLNAQTQEVTNPLFKTDQLIQQYMNLPDGSPQKIAAGRSLYPVFAGGMVPPIYNNSKANQANAASPMPGANMPMTGVLPSGMQLNPLQGGSRSGFHQAATTDASGNPTTMESPTMASASRDQMRKESEAESKFISPTILNGIKPYQGATPSITLLKDMGTMQKYPNTPAGQAAALRVKNYLIARRLIPEAAAINARQATGQAPGIEMLQEYKKGMFPSLPMDFVANLAPANLQAQATSAYVPLQQGLANQAVNQERTGYQQEGSPAWAAASNPSASDNLAPLLQGKNPTRWDVQQQTQQQPQLAQPIQMPAFKSDKEFDTWFLAQPREKQKQIRAQIAGGR